MYKYYKDKKYTIMSYDFGTIHEFMEYLNNTPTNEYIWGDGPLSSDSNDYDFCKTRSLEEAKEFCTYGYHEDFEKLVNLKITLEKYIKLSKKKMKQYNYYVGYVPDVKAYLEGNPLSMLNKQNQTKKHIDIYYNSAILGHVSTNEIFNRGAITLCIVEILESMGFTVDLNVFTMSQYNNEIHYAKFNLKRAGERLNIKKLYFPLCNPSFLRRLVFRLREETPDITRGWTNGYGSTCNDSTIRRVLDLKDNDMVICQPEEMGVRGKDIIDDANAMFKYINNFTSDDLELEHIQKVKTL